MDTSRLILRGALLTCPVLLGAAPIACSGPDGSSSDDVPARCEGAIVFAGPSIEEVIREARGIPRGEIRYADAAELLWLNAHDRGIRGLSGLGCLDALDGLGG
jgi:hypothetical protein